MLVDIDYAYSIREWGSDTFEVEDPKDYLTLEGLIRDELEAVYGKEAHVTEINIENVKAVRLDG